MKEEIKCKECGKISIPTYKEIPLIPIGGKNPLKFEADYVYDLCNECMSKGWTSDEKEIIEAFNNDQGFALGVKSPYGYKKY